MPLRSLKSEKETAPPPKEAAVSFGVGVLHPQRGYGFKPGVAGVKRRLPWDDAREDHPTPTGLRPSWNQSQTYFCQFRKPISLSATKLSSICGCLLLSPYSADKQPAARKLFAPKSNSFAITSNCCQSLPIVANFSELVVVNSKKLTECPPTIPQPPLLSDLLKNTP